MADIQNILAILFIIFLIIFIAYYKKKIHFIQIIPNFINFGMYRTKVGLEKMDSWSKKFPRLIKTFIYTSIVLGFIGMVVIIFTMIHGAYSNIFKPPVTQAVGLALPIKGPGIFYVPFFYWIISIFVLLVIHEFSHGLVARYYKIPLKSSGLAFGGSTFKGVGIAIILISLFIKFNSAIEGNFTSFNPLILFSVDFWLILGIILFLVSFLKNIAIPIIPGAFVEPDEEVMNKRPLVQRLGVASVGPGSNIIFGLLFLLIFFSIAYPFSNAVTNYQGIEITNFENKSIYPAEEAGILVGEVILELDGNEIFKTDQFQKYLNENKAPGDKLNIKTNKSEYTIFLTSNPNDENKPYMGIYVEQKSEIKDQYLTKSGNIVYQSIKWFVGLFFWLFLLNVGIGSFNLLPLGPLDGGLMSRATLNKYLEKNKAEKIWKISGLILLLLLIINIGAAFI